ncbi:MAG: glycosyltransferase family 4 protein [Candidatus Cloacimonetes bacterium]|nr:glycosyltransferase family 4 protein [Candidatus Cloacimonadota bacterium]
MKKKLNSHSKIKLLHIQLLPILSGVQRVTLNILESLDPKQYEMWLVCAHDTTGREKSLITEVKKIGVNVKILQSLKREIGLYDFRAFLEIYKFCRKKQFDIIHTHSSKTGFLGRIAGKLSGCRNVIHTVHGVPFHRYVQLLWRIFYYILEIIASVFCNKLVIVNKFYKKYFWYLPSRKLLTIHNGVDFKRFKPKRESNEEKIKIIFVGRLDKQKSPMTFVEAIKILLEIEKNIVVNIVGDGELYFNIKNYIIVNHLENNIILLGWREDVPELLAEHDIFCATSIYEPFGLVFCEAGFVGLPVVATNVDGVPEVVINRKTGLLVPPEQPKLTANAIYWLLHNKEEAKLMGKNANKWISDNFSSEKMVNSYKKVYESEF